MDQTLDGPHAETMASAAADEQSKTDATTLTFADVTVAEAYLRLLAARGIDYLFANAGTDFAPLIEAFSKAQKTGFSIPTPITVPHENVAVAMSMGYTLISGKAQAVMVHVNVGTANAICGMLNASRLRVPLLFTAGRTPILKSGAFGARSGFIHWPQEMYDQAGMVRETVKWDYELRCPSQLEVVIDRALSIANNTPRGPVYLTLPREVLASPLKSFSFRRAPRQVASAPLAADPAAIKTAARLLAKAEQPLVITSTIGRNASAVAALASLANEFALPVVSANPRFMELPSEHPMHMGYDVAPWLKAADLVLVVETAVPWIPAQIMPRSDAHVIHIGEAPLYEELPIRSFDCDLAIATNPTLGLTQLADVLRGLSDPAMEIRVARRRAAAEVARQKQRAVVEAALLEARNAPAITSTLVSRLLDEMRAPASIVFKESPLKLEQMRFTEPGTLFFAGAAGGLGWSLGAALGAQMAAPDREVIATVGDGAYLFGSPLAAHWVAVEDKLPVLFVVFNNRGWHAVRRATRAGCTRTDLLRKGLRNRSSASAPKCILKRPSRWPEVNLNALKSQRSPQPRSLVASMSSVASDVRHCSNVMCLPG